MRGAHVGELAYVRLSGNNPPGEHKTLELKIKQSETPQPPDGGRLCAAQARGAGPPVREPGEPYRSLVLSMWTAATATMTTRPRQGMVGGRRHRAGGMVKAPRTIPPPSATRRRARPIPRLRFVSANAGSGKTHVLVQRVIRCCCRACRRRRFSASPSPRPPAANMAERVFTTLGHWVTLDDDKLDAAIRDAGIARSTAKLRKFARELFASALETPGGLKVQTIHALCTRLLQQFPFEANVPARFTVLDDRDQAEMMERASLAVMLDASRAPDSAIGRALLTAMASAADVTFKEILREACLSRDHFMAWDRCRRQRRGRRAAGVSALGCPSMIASRRSSARSSTAQPAARAGRRSPQRSRRGSKTEQNRRRLREAMRTDSAQVDEYLGVF
jgi:ATP-dependent helicase/nuclease subunit A